MITAAGILLDGLALALALPVLVFCIEVVAALAGRGPRTAAADTPRRPVIAVVIPAHDEAAGITGTLEGIRAQLAPGDRMLVVADNCGDDTAAVAAAAGAQVIERTDPRHRGKGYALDFAIRHLAPDPPEAVIIVDADCQVAPGAIDRLSSRCAAAAGPVQALYLMRSPAGAGMRTRIAEFAWLVRNQVRAAGLAALGLPCQLTGSGMAFPWRVISGARLATGHITEDLLLGLDLALAGTPPEFCPDALVTSVFATANAGVEGQKTRWEHGHLKLIAGTGPRMLAAALAPPRPALLALALDLCVPPLALLCMLGAACWCLALALYLATGTALPLLLASGSVLALLAAVLAAWLRYGRAVLPLRMLALAPFYALWKIPLYGKFLVSRQTEWVRARRDPPAPHDP